MSEPSFVSAFTQAAKGDQAPASASPAPTPAPETTKVAPEAPKAPNVTQEVRTPDASKTASGQVEVVTEKGKYFEIPKQEAKPVETKTENTEVKAEAKPEVKTEEPKTNPELRKLYESVLRENKELKSRLPQADPAEIEALKRERDEALKTLERVKVEEHPNFRKQYVEPLEKTLKKVKDIVPAEVRGHIESLLRQPASESRLTAIENAISDLTPARQSEVLRFAGAAADILEARDAALAESKTLKTTWEQSEQIREREALQRQTQEVQGVVDDVFQEATKAFDILRENDDPVHNQKVSERISQARDLLFGKLTPDEVAKAAIWSVVGRESQALLLAANQRIQALSAELEKVKTARPVSGATTSSKDTKPAGAVEAMRSVLSGG